MGLRRNKKTPSRPTSGRQHPVERAMPRAFSYYATSSRPSVPTPAAGRHPAGSAPARSWLSRSAWRQLGHQFGVLALILLLFVCAASLLEVDTKPRVVILNDSQGYALHQPSAYQAAATTALRSSLLNTNKITIDTKSVDRALTQQFSEVASAAVALPLVGHRPTVYIELTKPTLILADSQQSVVVDSAGHALVTARDVSRLASFHLPTLTDQSTRQLAVGDTVLPGSTVDFIKEVIRQFTAAHKPIAKMVMPPAAEELDVYPRGVDYYGKFNLHETNARQQAGTFLAVAQQLAGEQGRQQPKHYIDVRIDGRAYYK